ncbi:hypothetical protein ATJ93_1922 [Halopiger aswanensis]|uniref:Uncharacterized protein n=1 Tax=Halopiger aswanensis TaxID=148449 RepID=A0A3R7DCZ2_9EURY|nr:hypothetical protein ATJ93_1922 [Halopiger aswanensis]
MAECDRCGDEVPRLFEHHTRTETMTHRRTRRVCADCHPSVSNASRIPVPDGGIRGAICPTCSGATIEHDGVYTCLECGWTGSS